MSALNENAITLLGSATIDTQNGDGKTVVYIVPIGKSAIITHVVIHSPSGSLVGGTDFDIGSGANADTWKQSISLTTMTATTDYLIITSMFNVVSGLGTVMASTPSIYTLEAAATEFGIKPITGATGDTTATMDVFGYLV